MRDKTNLCLTCLSIDRRLVSLKKIELLFLEIHLLELKVSTGGICWECWSILMNFQRFKKRAQIAQDTLTQSDKKHNMEPLTTLSVKTSILYDYQYIYSFDPLVNCDTDLKEETDSIKQEYNDITDDLNNTSDVNENITEITEKIDNVYVDTIETKHTKESDKESIRKNKIAKKRSKKDEKEIKEKFVEVVLSEEEMVRIKEEKRNHPNFKKIPYKCDSCVLGFTRKETYNIHMKKKHDESIGDYICSVCNIRFSSKSSAEKHKNKHYICYRCRFCKYKAHEMWSALNHCKLKHKADRLDQIHCSQCDVVVKTPEDLEEHIQTEHSLYCNECGVKFKGMNTLRRHKARIHAVKREFICDICMKTFMTKTRLESHMVTHNTTIAKKLAYCHFCNIQYKNIYVYRNHLKYSANHSEKAYPCSECNKKFASKVYWTKHYNFYHLQKSQFNCEICNKLFISDWRLKNHKQKHHGLSRSRDHTCNICGKKFFTIATLRSHELTHSEQRSYMCEDCGDTFKQRAALYTHARLVHKGGGQRK